MSCEPVTYNNLNRNTFECLKKRLADVGYQMPGDNGSIKGPMGITIQYEYNEKDESLFTHVTGKNFLVSCKMIYKELDKAIDACEAQGGGNNSV